jgi:hypothetical protein
MIVVLAVPTFAVHLQYGLASIRLMAVTQRVCHDSGRRVTRLTACLWLARPRLF